MDTRHKIIGKRAGIVVDCLMALLLLLQMLHVFTGNTVHEWLGIAFSCASPSI